MIYDLCAYLLDSCTTALSGAGYVVPSRSVVVDGQPSDDLGPGDLCEALYCWPSEVFPAADGIAQLSPVDVTCIAVPVVELRVRYIRCIDTREEASSVSVLDGEAVALHERAWVLWTSTLTAVLDGTLVPDCTCRNAQLQRGEWTGRSGGVAGFEFAVRIEVPWQAS